MAKRFMAKRLLSAICCLSILASSFAPAFGQSELRKALQKKYRFKSVSCYTCHAHVEKGTKDPKTHRNDFGKAFDAILADKDLTGRIKSVKSLSRSDPKKKEVVDAVVADFLTALEQVEKEKSPEGETYGELLKDGKLDGVKLRK